MKYNAYHGDHNLKETLIKLAKQHAEQDQYIKGEYGGISGGVFKGCSVGCSINDLNLMTEGQTSDYGDHAYLADKLGIPIFITRLQDCIFEGLPQDKSILWTERLFSAIPVDADLSNVTPKFLKFILESCLIYVNDFTEQENAIKQTISVMDNWIEAGELDKDAADAAAYAADAAAAAAARAAADAAADAAAYAAAAAAAAARAAADAVYEKYADKLIELIKECE